MLQGFWSDLCEQLRGTGALCGNKNGSPAIGAGAEKSCYLLPNTPMRRFRWNYYLRAFTWVDRGCMWTIQAEKIQHDFANFGGQEKKRMHLWILQESCNLKTISWSISRGTWGKSPTLKWLVGAYTLWSQDDCRANPETNLFSNRTGVQLFHSLFQAVRRVV